MTKVQWTKKEANERLQQHKITRLVSKTASKENLMTTTELERGLGRDPLSQLSKKLTGTTLITLSF